jgi:hypothetical protein
MHLYLNANNAPGASRCGGPALLCSSGPLGFLAPDPMPTPNSQFPGSSGQLPTQSPHRPVRAQLTHTVLQIVDLLSVRDLRNVPRLTCLYAIRLCFVSTALGSIAPSAFPADDSTIRRPSSLRRVPSGQVPLLPRYYKGATTSRCPSHLVSFPSLGDTIYLPTSIYVCSFQASGRFSPLARGFFLRQPLSGSVRHGDNEISQVPGQPSFAFALLSDPGGTSASGLSTLRCCPCTPNCEDSRV